MADTATAALWNAADHVGTAARELARFLATIASKYDHTKISKTKTSCQTSSNTVSHMYIVFMYNSVQYVEV